MPDLASCIDNPSAVAKPLCLVGNKTEMGKNWGRQLNNVTHKWIIW